MTPQGQHFGQGLNGVSALGACSQDSVKQIAIARNATDCQFDLLSAVQKVLWPECSIFV